MVFSSLLFLFLFLPTVLFFYFLSPKKLRNGILFLSSLIFYGWGEPIYILIMLFSTFFDYGNGLLIEKYEKESWKKKSVLILSIVINLGILGFFKYMGFFVQTCNGLFHLSLGVPSFPLPLGISFYTFQTLSYTIDVYRGKVKAQHHVIDFGTYVAMFPQLVAGPIVRYADIAKEMVSRRESLALFGEGVEQFLLGLGKKVLLANNVGLLWDTVKAMPPGDLTMVSAWLGILAFTFQIYFDFSGYSDMAIGLGKMFGFHFIKNFDLPYTAKSITEFWSRWHISLSSWFKEYVYIPLGGNRGGSWKQYRNIFIVWMLTGFWHGANWNFILWGLYYCFFLVLEKAFLRKKLEKGPAWVSHSYTLLVVMVGWVLFEHEDLHRCFQFMGAMAGLRGQSLADNFAWYQLLNYGAMLMVCGFCSTSACTRLKNRYLQKENKGRWILYLGFLITLFFFSTAYIVKDTYNPFLYFRF